MTVIGLPCHEPESDDEGYSEDDDEFGHGPPVPSEGNGDFFNLETFTWGTREPQALLFGREGVFEHISMLGGSRYGPPEDWVSGWQEGSQLSISHRWPRALPQGGVCFYTHAPLQGVVAAQPYYSSYRLQGNGEDPYEGASEGANKDANNDQNDDEEPYCSGVILHYENGGSRVVGQVRLIDENRSIAGEIIRMPKFICLEYVEDEKDAERQRIHFLNEADISENGGHPVHKMSPVERCPWFPKEDPNHKWNHHCYPMDGAIDWWFTQKDTFRVKVRAPWEE